MHRLARATQRQVCLTQLALLHILQLRCKALRMLHFDGVSAILKSEKDAADPHGHQRLCALPVVGHVAQTVQRHLCW